MTNPPDPGHPPRPQAPGGPGGPYGPPPGGPAGPFPGPAPGPGHGPVPGPRPPGPASGFQDPRGSGPGQGWTPPPEGGPGGRSVVGALFDLNFDNMITTRVVKLLYVLALIPISLFSLLMAVYGAAWIDDSAAFGYLLLLASPFVWLFQVFATRIVLEFVINQFKISEYLRAIKDKG